MLRSLFNIFCLMLCLSLGLPCLSLTLLVEAGEAQQTGGESGGGQQGGDQSQQTANQSKQDSGSSSGLQTGSITVGSNSGIIESYLLATAAAHEAANAIANDISSKDSNGAVTPLAESSTVIIFDEAEQTSLKAFAGFRVQTSILSTLYAEALKIEIPPLTSDLQQQSQSIAAAAALPFANSLVESAERFLSIFKTDITTGGVVVDLNNEIIIDEVAAALRKNHKIKTVRPSLFFPEVLNVDFSHSGVMTTLKGLYDQKNLALIEIQRLQAEMQALNGAVSEAKKKNDVDKQKELSALIPPREQKIAALQTANLAFDSLMSKLTATPSQGGPQQPPKTGTGNPVNGGADTGVSSDTTGSTQTKSGGTTNTGRTGSTQPAQQNQETSGDQTAKNKNQPTPNPNQGATTQPGPTLADVVMAELLLNKINQAGMALLTLQIDKSGGGYLTRSNIWTLFGGPRLYHMGGTVVSFTLLLPSTGEVLASGAVPVYGGFVKSSKVGKTIDTLMKK